MSVVVPLRQEFAAATSIVTYGRIPMFQPDNRNGCEKYDDSDDDECFLGVDKEWNAVYI